MRWALIAGVVLGLLTPCEAQAQRTCDTLGPPCSPTALERGQERVTPAGAALLGAGALASLFGHTHRATAAERARRVPIDLTPPPGADPSRSGAAVAGAAASDRIDLLDRPGAP